jgi:putative tricarboxylic transport membrane protein
MTETNPERRTPAAIDPAQYVLAAFILVAGAYVAIDASGLSDSSGNAAISPRDFPVVIGIVLIVLGALLAVATWRGDVPHEEAGEDIDLHGGTDWRTVAMLIGVVVANIALIDLLGWAITGAILFAGCAAVLGSRTWIRDIAIGAVLSVGSWYLFTVGLGVPLPAAILDGVL